MQIRTSGWLPEQTRAWLAFLVWLCCPLAASEGDLIAQLHPTIPVHCALLLEWFFLIGELTVHYFPLQVQLMTFFLAVFSTQRSYGCQLDVNKGLGKEVIIETGFRILNLCGITKEESGGIYGRGFVFKSKERRRNCDRQVCGTIGGSGIESCWLNCQQESSDECSDGPGHYTVDPAADTASKARGVCDTEDGSCLFCHLIITQVHQIHRRERYGRKQQNKVKVNAKH